MVFKKKLASILSAILLFCATNSYAENDKTLSLAYYQMSYEQRGIESVKPSMIAIQGNYHIMNGFSVEGRLAYALNTPTYIDGNNQTELDVSLLSSGFIKYNALHKTRYSPYVIAGYTYLEIETTATQKNGTPTLDNNAFSASSGSFGLGMDFKINPKLYIGVEYTLYHSDSVFDIYGSGLNLSYKF